MTTAAAAPNPVASASTPYESPKRIGLGASGSAARMPSRIRGVVGGLGQQAVTSVDVKVVVSGASGLIGSALVPALRAGGHEVTRLVRREGLRPTRSAGIRRRATSTRPGFTESTRSSTSAARTSASAGPSRAKREILESRTSATSLLATDGR